MHFNTVFFLWEKHKVQGLTLETLYLTSSPVAHHWVCSSKVNSGEEGLSKAKWWCMCCYCLQAPLMLSLKNLIMWVLVWSCSSCAGVGRWLNGWPGDWMVGCSVSTSLSPWVQVSTGIRWPIAALGRAVGLPEGQNRSPNLASVSYSPSYWLVLESFGHVLLI